MSCSTGMEATLMPASGHSCSRRPHTCSHTTTRRPQARRKALQLTTMILNPYLSQSVSGLLIRSSAAASKLATAPALAFTPLATSPPFTPGSCPTPPWHWPTTLTALSPPAPQKARCRCLPSPPPRHPPSPHRPHRPHRPRHSPPPPLHIVHTVHTVHTWIRRISEPSLPRVRM